MDDMVKKSATREVLCFFFVFPLGSSYERASVKKSKVIKILEAFGGCWLAARANEA